jgi:hypothetical protein
MDPVFVMEKFGSRIRDKHTGSATLAAGIDILREKVVAIS